MGKNPGAARPRIPQQPLVSGPGRGGAGVLALLLLVLVGVISAGDLAPPPPRSASAPATEFSAARAAEQLPELASRPRPIGTPAGERARDDLVERLRELGVEPEVQTATVQSPLRSGYDGSVLAGRVDNIVAVIPGTDPTGRVLLVAHYDSTMNSPGASDNGSSVVSILETVRALQSGPALRNDLVVVLTDGEEPGLLGAQAFVREHPLARDGGIVLNFDAGGSHGPSTMFETSAGSSCLIDAYTAVPHPFADSATATFYGMTSHNTDFTVFSGAGFAGMNSGFFRDSTDYHTPQDSIANLSPASLQHHGANMLSLARTFGAADLRSERMTQCDDSVFFTAFGTVVRHPADAALPLAVLGLLGIAAVLAMARRRGLITMPRMIAGFGAALVPLVLAPLAAFGLWQALLALRPGYADLVLGDPYRAELYRLAVIALTASVLVGWYAALRQRIGPFALAQGALLWPALLGVILAWAAPGASFLLVIPVIGAALGTAGALVMPPSGWRGRLVAITLGAAFTVFLLPQLVWELLASSGGIAAGAMVAFLMALLALPLLPVLELAFPERTGTPAPSDRPRWRRIMAGRGTVLTAVLLVLSGSLTGAGLVVDRFDADHPRPAHLHYVLDADSSTATWVSRDRQPSDWTCRYVDCGADADSGSSAVRSQAPWVADGAIRTGTAEPARLEVPEVIVLDDREEDGHRVLEVLLRSPRGAPVVSLYADRPVLEATVTGVPLTDLSASGQPTWAFGLELHAPPPEGAVVTLRLASTDPVRLRIVDHSYGLAGIPGFTARPEGIGIALAPSDVVSVGRTLTVSPHP
ncbi:M28 family peptidase [Brachybacterium phenoliresistens]|uniref:M28 family peptidase n=1 Tax=Brachybacterium phenoliresistens TaxID=396014 RepID=UPI0031CE9849